MNPEEIETPPRQSVSAVAWCWPPEGRHLFPYLTVHKNLLLGATQRSDKEINQSKGTSILLVEQNVHLAFGAAGYCYTLQVGELVAEGIVEDIRNNDVVKKAYFGG